MSEPTAQAQEPSTALPEPIHPEDMVAMKDTTVAPDPTMGRDTETDFMLRHVG